jgi:GSCFA family
MQFSTPISIQKSKHPIDYNSKIMSLGSCFAENMAEKFDYFKFQNTVNPFGIIFNAVSIERIIERIVNQEVFTENDIYYNNELWHCFEVHSSLSNLDKNVFLENLNLILEKTRNKILGLSHCIFTYGTSWVYRNIVTNQIVANCHKMPQKYFRKELLSIETTQISIEKTIALIQRINPKCHFIFTVSPVRHIKDGFVENNVSKAHLISAIYNSKFTIHNYFPSYEIILDELRDYRFYANDMLHPNQLAIDYVWEKFTLSSISENSISTMKDVETIRKMLLHKIVNPHSIKNQEFKIQIQEKINQLQLKNPKIIF